MLKKVVESFQNAMKPATELMTLNAKAIEQLVQQQATLVTGTVNNSVAYTKELMGQKDVSGIYKTQKEYLTGVKDSVVSASKEAYSVMSDTKEKAGELLKGAITAEVDAVKSAASKMTTKKSAATPVAE
jgi:phasin family protein